MTDDYIKIDWPDVKAGDVLMHENGVDRLEVRALDRTTSNRMTFTEIYAFGNLAFTPTSLEREGFSPYRKAAPVPTQPGAYLDKDGVLCVLTEDKDELLWWADVIDGGIYRGIEAMRHRAPFTRLVPMPTREALGEAIGGEVATAAVMALLSGDANEQEEES